MPIRNKPEKQMLIFLALLYFCLACSLIWLACFPAGRASMLHFLGGLQRRLQMRAGSMAGNRAVPHCAMPGQELRWRWRDARGWLQTASRFRRRRRAIGADAAIGRAADAPARYAARLRADSNTVVDAQVAALLKGEQLVPPASLPPVAFTTREVELVRPMLVDASRNWGLLHPDFSQRLLLAFRIMKEKYGYEMALLEGYRSPARQDLLAKMGSAVTNARPFRVGTSTGWRPTARSCATASW
jgi:peptidoglycan L-alanyl-D-glutamate endopeptidase CwlK